MLTHLNMRSLVSGTCIFILNKQYIHRTCAINWRGQVTNFEEDYQARKECRTGGTKYQASSVNGGRGGLSNGGSMNWRFGSAWHRENSAVKTSSAASSQSPPETSLRFGPRT